MGLKALVDSLDTVDVALHSFYEKSEDGKFKLKVEGQEDVTGLKSALQAERQIAKEANEKLKAFGDVSPQTIADLIEKEKQAEEAARKAAEDKALSEGKLEEVLLSRTEAMRREYENKLNGLQTIADTANEKFSKTIAELAETKITSKAIAAINEAGVPRKDAILDILARCRITWKMNEHNEPVALNSDGTQKLGKDGRSPITFVEWAEELTTIAPHLFEPSTGGGSSGSRKTAVNGVYTQEQLEKMSTKDYAALVRQGKL